MSEITVGQLWGKRKYTDSPLRGLGMWHNKTGSKVISALHGGRFNFCRCLGYEAIFPIIADRLIDDRSAIDTFPGIENQEEVREAFQHHQSFSLWAIHHSFLPHYEN